MTVAAGAEGGRSATKSRSLWGWRAVLAGLWLLMFLGAAPFAERPAPLSALYEAAADGGLGTVRLTEGLPPGATGYATQDIVWRDGVFLRRTTVVVASPGESPDTQLGERTSDDVAAQLRQRNPRIRLESLDRPGQSTSVYGWNLPGWFGPALIAHTLLTLVLLVTGPEPWRATRWAWFWLLTPPIGTIVFLLLSGPTPGLPRPARPGRRLTGGWAFLLAVAVSGVLSSS
jgi:hypothetical protein